MQRRQGKDRAYIAPPSHHSPVRGYGNEKGPRFGQRSFGVTNRIWFIVALFVFMLICTRYSLPTTHKTSTTPEFPLKNLKPKNYLNGSEAEPNPFQFCPIYGSGDETGLKYGAHSLAQTRLHIGSGDRLQRVLYKALSGQPVTISILGGSVSACHGAGDDPVASDCYPSRFFHWWNSVFPHPATELTNGAMRRTNAGYFGFCSAHHIPDVTDLVIIELDSDDTPDADMMENFETLVRSILLRPEQPAVILLGHFSPQVHQTHGFAGPDHLHTVVAQFYDIPHISTKGILFSPYLRDPRAVEKYYVDPVLASPAGHILLADVLIAFLQSQICTAWDTVTDPSFESTAAQQTAGEPHGIFGGVRMRKGGVQPGADIDGNRVKQPAARQQPMPPPVQPLSPVPPGRINTKPGARPFEEIAPYCVSANDLINPLPPSMFYGSGWNVYHSSSEGGTLRTTSHYWYSSFPTSKIRVPIQVGAGDIGVYYLREPIHKIGEGSAVECWVDDNYGGAHVIENAADIDEEMPTLAVIDHFVTRGSHYVECTLLGEEGQGVPMFKLIGIFST